MTVINVHENETLESAIKRFKKKLDADGTLKTWKANQFYMKPSAKRRERKKDAIRRAKAKNRKSTKRLY